MKRVSRLVSPYNNDVIEDAQSRNVDECCGISATQVNSVNRKEEAPELLMSYTESLLKLDQGEIVRPSTLVCSLHEGFTTLPFLPAAQCFILIMF